jgi:hypothetical protein
VKVHFVDDGQRPLSSENWMQIDTHTASPSVDGLPLAVGAAALDYGEGLLEGPVRVDP